MLRKLREEGKKTKDIEVKLYITEIKNNCIWAELAGATSIMGALFSYAEYTNTFIEFVTHLNGLIRYFISLPSLLKNKEVISPRDIEATKKECSNVYAFLKVVSAQKGNLSISVAEYKNDIKKEYVKFEFTSEQASEAGKGAILAQGILEARGDADYEKVLMYYYQTNSDESKAEGRTGEQVIIQAVSPKPLPVHIVSPLDRERLMSQKDDPNLNPFKVSYLVDVNVETDRHGIPRHYRVIRIHETLPENEEPTLFDM